MVRLLPPNQVRGRNDNFFTSYGAIIYSESKKEVDLSHFMTFIPHPTIVFVWSLKWPNCNLFLERVIKDHHFEKKGGIR